MKEPRVLGAVIAGGESRRFGSDKALALIAGRPMIEHVIEALRSQVDSVIISGRTWPDMECIQDRTKMRLGPLAGLESAFRYAVAQGFDGVLSVPVDTLPLPLSLKNLLVGDVPRALRNQLLIGYWPTGYRDALTLHIERGARSVRSWVAESRALMVDEPIAISNINWAEDLKTVQRNHL